MQPPGPPRPFRGAQYDKEMFTFLPAHNRDKLADSSRKRKLTCSDHQIPIPAPIVRHGVSGNLDSKLNAGTLQGKEIQSSAPASGPREFSRGHSDQRQYWDQNNYAANRQHHNDRGFHESGSEYTGYTSSCGKLQSPEHMDVLADSSRKRKLTSSDHQITVPAPIARHGVSGNFDSKLNAGTLQGKEIQSSAPASGPRESSKGYSDQRQYWDQNDNAEKRWHHNNRGFHETGSEYTVNTSFSGQLQSPKHKVSSPLFPLPEGRTLKTMSSVPPVSEDFNQHDNYKPISHVTARKGSNWPPMVSEGLSRCENRESNAHVTTHNSLDWQPPDQLEVRESNAIVVTQNASNWPSSMTRDVFQHGNFEPNARAAIHKSPNGPPSETQDLSPHNDCESNAYVAREANAPRPQECWSHAHQKPVEPRAMASDIHKQASISSGESQILPHTVFNPVAVVGDLDGKGRDEEVTYKVDCPNAKEYGDAGVVARFENAETYKVRSSSHVERSYTDSSAGFDNSEAPRNNVNSSVYNLQNETDNLLNVLKLLAASGIKLADKKDENAQGARHDDKMMKSLPGSIIQNHPPAHTNLSKNYTDPVLNEPAVNSEIANECKSENGASTFAEKLWDGTLQLSTSVFVSAIAFFKSGEKMQDFSWSDSVEVRGKVRLEAFEKYVQDLPRSRSRGLMVMSLCWKEGSSDAGHKGMKEVARKYKEGKRVGVAKLSTDVDLYICPHSDAIITILAKHGFFKGMTAIKEKSEPLLGCVVWKKNSSSAPATKTAEANPLQLGHTMMEVATSEKGQTLDESVQNSRIDNSPELLPCPLIDQAKQSMVIQDNVTSVSGASSQLSDFKTDVELHKPTLPITSVSSKQSADFSDDDLPEYDFRAAASQASVSNASAVAAPISAEIKAESSPVSVTVPDSHLQQSYSEAQKSSFPTQEQNQNGHFQGPAPENMGQQHSHFQGLVPQNLKRYYVHKPSFQTQEQNQTGDFRGPVPQNMGQQSEVQIPSLPILEQKPIEKGDASSKPRNLFDNDDMPEWCPPDFLKTREEAATKSGPSFSFSNSKVGGSGFANLTSGCLLPLPPPPPPPPLTQMLLESKNHHSAPHLPKPAANGFTHEHPAAVSSQTQFKDRDYSSVLQVPPPPPVGTNNITHHSTAIPSTQMHFGDRDPAAISSQMQFKDKDYSSVPHVPPSPPVGNSATSNVHHSRATPSTQMHIGDRNPAAISSKMQLNEREYCSAPYAPPPPPVGNLATNTLMHCSPAVLSTQMQFGDTNPAAMSSQMPFKEREYHSAPHVPPPPLVGYPSTNNLMHHSPAAPPNQLQFRDTNLAAVSSKKQFNEREYRSAPHVPPPPPVGNPATSNLMHHSPAAPSIQMQFGDKNPAAISSQMYHSTSHAPPPPVNNPAANNFMHHNPAARSTQMQVGDTNYSTAHRPSTPYIGDPPNNGPIHHKNPAFPLGSAPNPAYRPYFDQPGTKNPIRPPIRNTRP